MLKLQINGQFQAAKVCLVTHIGDFPNLSGLDELRHLVHNDLGCGAVGNLRDLNEAALLHIAPLGAQTEAAPAGGINFPGGGLIVQQLCAGGEIRPRQGLQNVVVRILHQRDGGIADLFQVKGADIAGHANGNALVC